MDWPSPAPAAPPASPSHAELCAALLAGGKRVRFRAPGASMEPTIRHGEAVEVAPVAPENLRVGDVVLSHGPRGLLAHRLIRIDERGAGARFTTRGDAANEPDPAVAKDGILGRVVSVERDGRRIRLAGIGAALRYREARAFRLGRHLLGRVRSRLP